LLIDSNPPPAIRAARWGVFHRPDRYFTGNLAEADKRPILWKSVPDAGVLKINPLP